MLKIEQPMSFKILPWSFKFKYFSFYFG